MPQHSRHILPFTMRSRVGKPRHPVTNIKIIVEKKSKYIVYCEMWLFKLMGFNTLINQSFKKKVAKQKK